MDDMSVSMAKAIFAAKGLQVRRKDKDLMSDTGGTSKVREREPQQKPPRDDMKKPHRTKDKPSKERDTDTDKDKDRVKDGDMRTSSLVERVARTTVASNTAMMAKSMLSRYPRTLRAEMGRT